MGGGGRMMTVATMAVGWAADVGVGGVGVGARGLVWGRYWLW